MSPVDAGRGAQIGRVVGVLEVVEAALERPVALAEGDLGEVARRASRTSPRRGACAPTRSGSCRCSQRSLGPTDCCVMPAPVRSQHLAASAARRSARRSRRARGRRCRAARGAAAGRRRRAAATHGTQPGHADAGDRRRARCRPRRRRAGSARARSRATRPRPAPTSPDAARPAEFGSESAPSRPRSGSSTTALTAVVPRSRPSSTRVAQALRAASRKRRTRSRSTGFQVPPSRLRSLPTMTPSMNGANAAMLAALRAGVEHDRRAARRAPPRPRARCRPRARAPAIGPETRIASASEETTAERARAPTRAAAERRGELGRDVHEHAEVVRVVGAALAQQRGGVGLPQAHVALVDARA